MAARVAYVLWIADGGYEPQSAGLNGDNVLLWLLVVPCLILSLSFLSIMFGVLYAVRRRPGDRLPAWIMHAFVTAFTFCAASFAVSAISYFVAVYWLLAGVLWMAAMGMLVVAIAYPLAIRAQMAQPSYQELQTIIAELRSVQGEVKHAESGNGELRELHGVAARLEQAIQRLAHVEAQLPAQENGHA